MISIAIVDDHRLMRAGLANMIAGFKGYKVTIEAGNGLLFIESLKKNKAPSIVLLDINSTVDSTKFTRYKNHCTQHV